MLNAPRSKNTYDFAVTVANPTYVHNGLNRTTSTDGGSISYDANGNVKAS